MFRSLGIRLAESKTSWLLQLRAPKVTSIHRTFWSVQCPFSQLSSNFRSFTKDPKPKFISFLSMGGQPSKEDEELKGFIDKAVKETCVVIFSKTTCPHCKSAKDVFVKLGAKFLVVELNERPDGDDLKRILGDMTGQYTVPRVFVNGKCIGGGSETKALYQKGKLKTMIDECNKE